MKSYQVTLPVPPSVNRMYRVFRGRVFMVRQGKDYKTLVEKTVREKYGSFEPFSGLVQVVINVYRPAKRGDLDNFLKCLLDGLQGTMYNNDKQIHKIIATRFDDKKNPRVEVIVNGLQ